MNEALELVIPLVKVFEGCRLKSYQDIVGIWTIGYGETLGVTQDMVWTQEQADTRLKHRLNQFMLGTLKKCPQLFKESPEKLAACTSLAYNIGLGAFGVSSVCRKTKRMDYVGAADSVLLWNKAGGKVVKGLALRRQKEHELYLS